MNRFHINPVNLIQTLSMALELAVDGMNTHMWRTSLICRRLAEEMGLKDADLQNLLYAALMHDIGAVPNIEERLDLQDPDKEAVFGPAIFDHAEAGYLLFRDSLFFGNIAEAVRYHHDHWEGGNPSGLSGERIPLHSRIILVADRIEVLIDKARPILSQAPDICAYIDSKSGTQFDPAVVEAFLRCAQKEVFWLDLVNTSYYGVFFDHLKMGGQARFTIEEVVNVAGIYATIIDRMSIFTATHSRSVSEVSVLLAARHGFCEHELQMMRVAGLLHDLGKLSVPNSILEKAGPLTPGEIMTMRQHTYYTYRILERIDNFSTIAQWAAFHHETLDGQGYPFRLAADALPLGSRIMAVADIFVALAENRPYRKRLHRDAITRIMNEQVARNKIDGHIVDSLFELYEEADAIVVRMGETNGKIAEREPLPA